MAKAKFKGEEKTPEEKFKTFWLAWNLIEDALLIIAGALSIVFGIMVNENSGAVTSDTKVIENIILYVLASFIVLDGILRTVLLAKRQSNAETSAYLIGGFEITIGIVLMILGSETFFKLIINFLGVFLLVIGALFLFVSIRTIVKHLTSMLMPVLEIFFGAILIGFGTALMIIYHAGEVQIRNRVSYILIGTILAIAGIAMLIGLFIGKKKEKHDKKKAEKQEVFDVRKEEVVEEPSKPSKKKKRDIIDAEEEPKAIEEKGTDDDTQGIIEVPID
ncbi:MAG: hypothetical protein II467_06665 [Bacilli bacterium]|nr:hypothetical protein [Bacilli bacterium]